MLAKSKKGLVLMDTVHTWAYVHVAHVKRSQAVEDDANSDHPHQQQTHCVPLVIEYPFEQTHG